MLTLSLSLKREHKDKLARAHTLSLLYGNSKKHTHTGLLRNSKDELSLFSKGA